MRDVQNNHKASLPLGGDHSFSLTSMWHFHKCFHSVSVNGIMQLQVTTSEDELWSENNQKDLCISCSAWLSSNTPLKLG